MKSIFLFCLFALSFSYVACGPTCSPEELTRCVQDLHIVTSSQDLSYGENENELDITCQILEGAMQCVNTYARRCMDSNQREMFQEIMRGPQSLVDDLCTEGSEFRSEYLRHASCFKNTTDDLKACYGNFKRKENIIKISPLSPTSRMRKTCCIFNDYKHCTREFLVRKCSTAAADFADKMVNKAGGTLVATYCGPYTFAPGDC